MAEKSHAESLRIQVLLLAAAAEQTATWWRTHYSIPVGWLLPPEEVLRDGLTAEEQRLYAYQGGGPVLANMLWERVTTPAGFPPGATVRQRDVTLLAALDADRAARVWPTLPTQEEQERRSYTRSHGPYGYTNWVPGTQSSLQNALIRSSLPHWVITWRIQRVTAPDWLMYSGAAVGQILQWPQPMSTRVDPEPLGSLCLGHVDLDDSPFATALPNPPSVKFEIRAHQGIFIGNASLVASRNEQEFLLPAGTTFRVEGHVDAVVREGNGSRHRRHFVQLQQLTCV